MGKFFGYFYSIVSRNKNKIEICLYILVNFLFSGIYQWPRKKFVIEIKSKKKKSIFFILENKKRNKATLEKQAQQNLMLIFVQLTQTERRRLLHK